MWRPFLEGVAFKQLSLEERSSLKALFLVNEIKEVVWPGDNNKCLGPKGFDIGFFKTC